MTDKDLLQQALQDYVDKALLAEVVTDTAQEILKELKKTLPELIAEDIVGNMPMSTGEDYTGSHARYWVSPAHDADLSWEDRIVHNRALNEWCTLTYGPKGVWHLPDCRWFSSNGKYFFINETDRTMFILRWS